MNDESPHHVLVAVESQDCEAALRTAAEEARRRRCAVHLVHVVPLVRAPVDERVRQQVHNELREIGVSVLDSAETELRRGYVNRDLPVSSELVHGEVVPALVARSRDADLVVMQHRGMGADGVAPALCVTTRVAAHAYAPVLAVPRGWRADQRHTSVVTVGVRTIEAAADHVVRVALEWASRADSRLRLFHADETLSDRPGGFGRLVEVRRARRQRAALMEAFAPLASEHPGVPVEIVVSSDPPRESLLMNIDASLFVVGRRHAEPPLASHLGSVTRTALRWSPVPVLVVDPVVPYSGRPISADLATTAIP